MCGIAGIVVAPGERVESGTLARLNDSLLHRGPDDGGYLGWCPGDSAAVRTRTAGEAAGGRVGLVHRRLSILDLSPLGWQPMSTPDGRHHIVYNGEVYNYIELRAELERLGRRFVSHSDTEVMLAALAEWGVDAAVRRFEGMFAFALLDVAAGTLTLARDAFGIKPLYYAMHGGRLAFASEIKALLDADLVPRTADPAVLYAYLAHGETDLGEETSFAAVRRLLPAGILEIDVRGAPRVVGKRTFWTPPLASETLDVSRAEAASLVREAFLTNVSHHLRSDVPVGAALSGGIDSSAIVTAMRRVSPEVELHSFSYLADDPRISEERWVRSASTAARSQVHEVRLDADGLARDVDRLVRTQDEPFGSTSIYAQYNVFRAAADAGVRVMLDGQGADELLGGYSTYLGPRVAGLVLRGRLLSATRLVRTSSHFTDVDTRGVLRYVAASSVPAWVKRRLSARVHGAAVPAWMDASWLEARGVPLRMRVRDAGPDLRAQLASSVTNSLQSLLRYEDRNSMAFSVESRVPFLTTGFAELLLSLPEQYLIAPDGVRKAVLRDAMRGIVPDDVLDRRDKLGFPTPQNSWLRTLAPWTAAVLGGDAVRRLPLLRADALQRAAAQVSAGGDVGHLPLWRWLNLLRWMELNDVTVP